MVNTGEGGNGPLFAFSAPWSKFQTALTRRAVKEEVVLFNNRPKNTGSPLGLADCVFNNSWQLVNNMSIVQGRYITYPGDDASEICLSYFGKYENWEDCFDTVKMSNCNGTSYTSFTWFDYSEDNINGNWTSMCYGRAAEALYSARQPTKPLVSGNLGGMDCSREFEHASVRIKPVQYEAWIDWK